MALTVVEEFELSSTQNRNHLFSGYIMNQFIMTEDTCCEKIQDNDAHLGRPHILLLVRVSLYKQR